MIDPKDMAERNRALVALLREKHGVRAKDLGRAVRRAGRLLPRRIRTQADVLIEAERLSAIPKLAKRVNVAAVNAAEKTVRAHLEAIDVRARRNTRLLNMAGLIAGQMLIVGVAFIVWLWWRAYI